MQESVRMLRLERGGRHLVNKLMVLTGPDELGPLTVVLAGKSRVYLLGLGSNILFTSVSFAFIFIIPIFFNRQII